MGVTSRSLHNILPILLPATRKTAEAFVFLQGKARLADVLPEDALRVFESEDGRRDFEARFGQVAASRWAGIEASLALIHAIENRDLRVLKGYVAWQTVAEVKLDEEFAERFVQAVNPEFREIVAGFPAEIRKLRDESRADERRRLNERLTPGDPLTPLAELLVQINRWIHSVKLVLFFHRKHKRPLPGLFCPDAGTALAVMVLNKIPASQGLGVCRRPSCGKSFLRLRSGQQYCSLRCGNADRKARERSRSTGD